MTNIVVNSFLRCRSNTSNAQERGLIIMKKSFIKTIASILAVTALTLPVNITCVAAAEPVAAAGTPAPAPTYLTPFESRYDLTSNSLSIDSLTFDGVKEVNTVAEWEEYLKACVDRGYHFVFFKAAPGLTFNLNSFMNKYGITYAVTHTITRSNVTYTGYEFTYTSSYDILNAVKAGKESTLTEKQQLSLQAARTFLATLPADMGSYEKELAIHNYVCEKISYTKDHTMENITDCYGGLILGRGNCSAYTDAFNLVAGLAGFTTGRVLCTVDSGLHTLNYILIDGEYYFVDCTFDDGIASDRGYGLFYFNLPYSVIAKTHALQDVPFELKPGVNSYGYYQHYGTYADSPASLFEVYKKLANSSAGGEMLFNTSNGTASLIELFNKYHPAGKTKIATSTCAIGEYQILKFTLN